MERLYFCFNGKKTKGNIALLEKKQFGKGYFKPSEKILFVNFFQLPRHGCRRY